ncbi:hypothetical protein BDY19DRAFT_989810 [Irpex rosettiformis]|uniref:Uncharacterized protein n=1 Tax=Irpex rosettiformis TaxID=378272 RepID=A0ACB8UFT5_9APHY|nr:hypothetical protein BDY19DRAFT_989810 [Irpex rosettiformis]
MAPSLPVAGSAISSPHPTFSSLPYTFSSLGIHRLIRQACGALLAAASLISLANYVVAIDGQSLNVWDTSASSPVLAAILSAINDARLTVGKSTIGFINTTICSNNFRDALDDIIDGTNPECGTNGFSAVTG